MLTLNYSGWNKDYGAYSFDVPFDDSKTDWEILFKKDTYYQLSPFAEVTRDWNCDGDVHAQYGAWFGEEPNGFASDFYTPEQMLRLVVDGEATVPGLPDPSEPIRKHAEEKQRKAFEAELARQSRSVSFKDKHGRNASVLFDAKEDNYRIHLPSGKSFFQTSRFEDRPRRSVGRGDSFDSVFGAWFQSNSETLEAIFFTPEEIVQMALNEKTVLEGGIPLSRTQEQAQTDADKRTCTKRTREPER